MVLKVMYHLYSSNILVSSLLSLMLLLVNSALSSSLVETFHHPSSSAARRKKLILPTPKKYHLLKTSSCRRSSAGNDEEPSNNKQSDDNTPGIIFPGGGLFFYWQAGVVVSFPTFVHFVHAYKMQTCRLIIHNQNQLIRTSIKTPGVPTRKWVQSIIIQPPTRRCFGGCIICNSCKDKCESVRCYRVGITNVR